MNNERGNELDDFLPSIFVRFRTLDHGRIKLSSLGNLRVEGLDYC